MASCADCKRILFGRVIPVEVEIHGYRRTVCDACARADSLRSVADRETHLLEAIHRLPSPIVKAKPSHGNLTAGDW